MKRRQLRALLAGVLVVVSALPAFAPSAAASTATVDAPGWQVLAPEGPRGDSLESAVNGHDITGDGVDDLLLRWSPGFSFGSTNASFDVVAGGAGGLSTARTSRSTVPTNGYSFGSSSPVTYPQAPFDFNGDGFADAVSTDVSYFSSTGLGMTASADVFFGSASGLAATASCTFARTSANYSISWSWRAGGDFDGDGKSDLLLLATDYGDIFGNTTKQATVSLSMVPGGATCPSTWKPAVDLTPLNMSNPSLIGWGDFNDDGADDAAFSDTVYSPLGTSDYIITVVPGGPGGPGGPGSAPLDQATQFTVAGATYGTSFLPGLDLNGDGYGDLVLMTGYQAGFGREGFSILTYPGSASGLMSTAGAPEDIPGVGYSGAVPSVGDFDGDGNLDLMLETGNQSAYPSVSGTCEVFFGAAGVFRSPSDWNRTFSVTIGNGSSFNSAGLDASGDFDGDGLSDIVVAVGGGRGPVPIPLAAGAINAPSDAVLLVYYGKDIQRDVAGVSGVGFESGVGYPTYEYGFDVAQRAANRSYFDRFAVRTVAGTLAYDTGSGNFSFIENASQPAGTYFVLHPNSTAAWDDATGEWTVHFRFEFSWNFPTEDNVTYGLELTRPGGQVLTRGNAGQFRVEKDLAFSGSLLARDATASRALAPGGWVAGGAALDFTGLTVNFEGAPQRTVDPRFYNWTAADDEFDTFYEAGGPLNLRATAEGTTDPNDTLTFGLTGTPDPSVGTPTAEFPFRVDADAPRFAGALPGNDSWIASTVVTIGILAQDSESGVDVDTLEYAVSTAGPGSFGSWFSPSSDASDPASVRARAATEFANGEANYFKFRVKDLVGNGFTESAAFQVRVDTLHVNFKDPTPDPGVWQTNATVDFAVTISDAALSGVDASTVAYRVSSDDIFGYGPWTQVAGLTNSVEIAVKQRALFAEGDLNFVQWRAGDLAGNGLTLSDNYGNRVDATPLSFGSFTPAPGARTLGAVQLVSMNFTEGRARTVHQSGVNASSVEYRFRPAGGEFGPWSSAGLTVLDVDGTNWSALVEVSPAPGPGNEVGFRASDLAGNAREWDGVVRIHRNRAPTVDLNTTDGNLSVVVGHAFTVNATAADADGDNVSLEWRDEHGALIRGNETAKTFNLTVGNHTFTVAATDSFGAETEANITVEVRPVPPPPEPVPTPTPPPPEPTVQTPQDMSGLLAAVLLLAAIGAVAALTAARRRRREPPA